MDILPPTKIKIISIRGKGRGVIATQDIFSGEIIEYCPIIFLSDIEVDFLDNKSDILKFYYLLQPEANRHILIMGYGSMYNHSKDANAEIDYDIKKSQNFIFFRALKVIKAGQEIVFDYNSGNKEEKFLELK